MQRLISHLIIEDDIYGTFERSCIRPLLSKFFPSSRLQQGKIWEGYRLPVEAAGAISFSTRLGTSVASGVTKGPLFCTHGFRF